MCNVELVWKDFENTSNMQTFSLGSSSVAWFTIRFHYVEVAAYEDPRVNGVNIDSYMYSITKLKRSYILNFLRYKFMTGLFNYDHKHFSQSFPYYRVKIDTMNRDPFEDIVAYIEFILFRMNLSLDDPSINPRRSLE